MRSTILLFLVLTIAPAGTKVKERHAVYPQRSEIMTDIAAIPSVELAKSLFQKTSADLGSGIVIGTTDYDYALNSGFARRITSANSSKIHMIFPSRDVTLSSPLDRLRNKYCTYDQQTGTLSTSVFIHGFPVEQEGFGSLDVFSGGAGEGIAVAAYTAGKRAYFAIDGGPASGSFTHSVFPEDSVDYGISEPQLTIMPDQQSIWVTAATSSGNCFIARSSDFGTNWIFKDSLKKYMPNSGFVLSDKSSPMLIDKQGTLYRVSTLKGRGALPPIGNAHPDSADRIGYFKSTNNGTSWTWTTIRRDGDPLVVSPGDTVYTLIENYSQFSGAVDDSSVLYVVANGYSLKRKNDSTLSNRFYTLYWNSSRSEWKIISWIQHGSNADYDSSYYRYTGNAIGFPYPSITVNDQIAYVFWSQPKFQMNRLDTTGGNVQYQLYYCIVRKNYMSSESNSLNGSTGGLFSLNDRYMYSGNGEYGVRFLFLNDTVRGLQRDLPNPKKVPWILRKVGIWIENVFSEGSSIITFKVSQNYPNPFNPSTTIQYELSHRSHVTMEVFDLLGRNVQTLVDEVKAAGEHFASFNGSHLASGIYYYRMTAGSFSEVKKMTLLK